MHLDLTDQKALVSNPRQQLLKTHPWLLRTVTCPLEPQRFED
uniref:Uncharacterized protein n=1 Tax=Anguilla anguilla TaxID=7936 RepID=A0A0E9T1S6_ANGAN